MAVTFRKVLAFPQHDAFAGFGLSPDHGLAYGGGQGELVAHLGPARVGGFVEKFGGLAWGSKVARRCRAASWKDALRPQFPNSAGTLTGRERRPLFFLQHGPEPLEGPIEQRPSGVAEDGFLHRVAVMQPGDLGHPRRAGLVDRALPEVADNLTAVIHGVCRGDRDAG